MLNLMYATKGSVPYESATLRPTRRKNQELELESNLFRCMSDASLVKRRRRKGKSAAQRETERQHRFSINGHFYNYKVSSCYHRYWFVFLVINLSDSMCSLLFLQTSIFTPSFGTSTKVRISSRMTTNQVIEQLLNKFKVILFLSLETLMTTDDQ